MAAVQTRGVDRATAYRWIGLLGGLAVTSWLLRGDTSGRAVLLVGPVLGTALLAGVLLGELSRPRLERGPARRALLETRRVADYLPGRSRLVAVMLVAYVLTVAGTGLRSVISQLDTTVGDVCYEVGLIYAWPSAAATVPALAGVVLGLAAAAAVLRRIVLRPRPAGIEAAEDDRSRREAVTAVVTACALLVAGPLAGTALVAGGTIAGSSCAFLPVQVLGWGLLWIAGAAGIVACWSLVALLRPRRAA
jgi:hypothetical protein